jgi:hypothetical protein
MKLFHMAVILSLSILVSSCAVIDVDYDYDAGFDFSNLSRYSWLEMPVDFPVDDYSIQRIKAAVNQQMKEKGFCLTTGSADFILSLQGYKDTVRQSPQSTSVSPVTGERSASEQFQQGMFTLTIIDTKTDRRIWQGHAKGLSGPNLSTEDRVKKTNEAVAKLLSNFPPNNK